MLLSFVAAVVGGLVCGTITRKSAGPAALAIVVVALGVAFAIPTLRAPPLPTDRGPNVGVFEAMQHARQPSWAILVTPLIGALGVLVGARFVVGRTGALGEPCGVQPAGLESAEGEQGHRPSIRNAVFPPQLRPWFRSATDRLGRGRTCGDWR